MARWLIIAGLLPALASAAVGDPCDDGFDDCKETCSLEFGGSIRDAAKKKFAKCMKKCTKKQRICRERVLETKSNNLDEGALAHSPSASEVDENGMPKRTTGAKAREDDAPVHRDDDVGVKASKTPKPELKDEDVPKSTRTRLADKPEPAKSAPKEDKTSEPARTEKPKELVIESMPDKGGRLDEDLRDDGDRPAAEAPKKSDKRRDETRDREPPPPRREKEEDHDDLRNY